MQIVIDPDILFNSYRTLGCLCATLQELGHHRDVVNRYGDRCARIIMGNTKFTMNNFLAMQIMIKADFDIEIIKGNNTKFTLEDFTKNEKKKDKRNVGNGITISKSRNGKTR